MVYALCTAKKWLTYTFPRFLLFPSSVDLIDLLRIDILPKRTRDLLGFFVGFEFQKKPRRNKLKGVATIYVRLPKGVYCAVINFCTRYCVLYVCVWTVPQGQHYIPYDTTELLCCSQLTLISRKHYYCLLLLQILLRKLLLYRNTARGVKNIITVQ